MLTPLLVAATCAAVTIPATVERQFFIMGTTLTISATAPSVEQAAASIDRAFVAVQTTDRLLSTWHPESELAKVNAAPVGTSLLLSRELATILAEAFAWDSASGGTFHPAIGALISAWDLRGAGRVPSPTELQAARDAASARQFTLTRDGRIVRHHADAWLDSGAFGKGVALRAAAAALRATGITAATLNFGGQLLVIGNSASPIAIADPVRRDRKVVEIRIANQSVATSGQSERTLIVDGRSIGHVLDPRTGLPVPAWGSVTVVAPDPVTADVLATALLVLGPIDGLRWAATERKPIAALFIISGPEGLEYRATHAFEPFLATSHEHTKVRYDAHAP